MESIITFLVYILGMVAVIAILSWTITKLDSHDSITCILNKMIDKGYEVENIDINKLIKN